MNHSTNGDCQMNTLLMEPGPGAQTAAPEPEDAARVLLRVLPALMRDLVATTGCHGRPEFVHPAQFRVLDLLSERDYRVGELARLLRVGAPSLSVTVDSLVRRGL